MLSEVATELLDISHKALDAPIHVALVRVCLGPQDVRGLLTLLEEVPDIWGPHLFKEFALLFLGFDLLLLFLRLAPLHDSVVQVDVNYLLYFRHALPVE